MKVQIADSTDVVNWDLNLYPLPPTPDTTRKEDKTVGTASLSSGSPETQTLSEPFSKGRVAGSNLIKKRDGIQVQFRRLISSQRRNGQDDASEVSGLSPVTPRNVLHPDTSIKRITQEFANTDTQIYNAPTSRRKKKSILKMTRDGVRGMLSRPTLFSSNSLEEVPVSRPLFTPRQVDAARVIQGWFTNLRAAQRSNDLSYSVSSSETSVSDYSNRSRRFRVQPRKLQDGLSVYGDDGASLSSLNFMFKWMAHTPTQKDNLRSSVTRQSKNGSKWKSVRFTGPVVHILPCTEEETAPAETARPKVPEQLVIPCEASRTAHAVLDISDSGVECINNEELDISRLTDDSRLSDDDQSSECSKAASENDLDDDDCHQNLFSESDLASLPPIELDEVTMTRTPDSRTDDQYIESLVNSLD